MIKNKAILLLVAFLLVNFANLANSAFSGFSLNNPQTHAEHFFQNYHTKVEQNHSTTPINIGDLELAYHHYTSDTPLTPKGGIPFGFKNTTDFNKFGNNVNVGLKRAGYDDAQGVLQGSAVTGKKFTTGQLFDVGRVSDFDVAISSPSILNKAKTLGIPLRSQGTRTAPLTTKNLEQLGLEDLAKQLSQQSGRDVNFMIFDSVKTATKKAPSILLPTN